MEEQGLREFFDEMPEGEQALQELVDGMPEEEQEARRNGSGGGAEEKARLSRRQFLTGAAVGGAAGLAVAAGTGAAVWKMTDAEAQVALENANAEAQAALDEANAEIARLRGLLGLFEALEGVGLDSILAAGMAAVTLPLQAIEAGAEALKGGLEAIEGTLLSIEDALPSARESLAWLESQVSLVAGGIEKLETALSKALDRATDNPVAEALGDFSQMVLDRLPFGLGDRIRGVLERLVEFVTSVDELVEGINSRVLEPLDEKWFSGEDGKGMGALVVDPVVKHVLDPVEAHLEDLAALADTWQAKLLEPTKAALAERDQIRAQMADYRDRNGLA